MTAERLDELVDSEAVTLLVAYGDGRLVGMLTLVSFPIPTGRRAWLEDVVVDDTARGRGIGIQLMRAAVGHALYRRLGFVQRDTNVCRYKLS